MKVRSDFVSNSSSSSFIIAFRKKGATKEEFMQEMGISPNKTCDYFKSQAEGIYDLIYNQYEIYDEEIQEIRMKDVAFMSFDERRKMLKEYDDKHNVDYEADMKKWMEEHPDGKKTGDEDDWDFDFYKPHKTNQLGKFEEYVKYFELPED